VNLGTERALDLGNQAADLLPQQQIVNRIEDRHGAEPRLA
jgi:hypothetical protein